MVPVRRWEIAVAVGLGLLFLSALLVYGPFDDEEAALGIFASQLHYEGLLHGKWLFWLDNLGFGTPLPIGHRLDFHPVFALSGFTSLRTALSALWVAHIAVMVVYFLRLAAVTGIRPPLRTILLACYVFSAVSVCLFYQTDWVTGIIGWTLFPVVVFYVRQAVMGEARTNFWLASIRLGLLAGFLSLNSHPGYLAPLAITLAVYTVVAAPLSRPVYSCLIVAAILGVAVSAERLYVFGSEMQRFPASLPRATQEGYAPIAYAAAAVAPIVPARDTMRLPFIGVVFGLAALVSAFRLRSVLDPHLRACALAFLAALLLSVAPPQLSFGASGVWLFRDPMVFFGLLAGGFVLQRALDSPAKRVRQFTWALIFVQVVQQALTIWPGFYEYGRHTDQLLFYRHQKHASGLGRTLVDQAGRFGPRLYFSEVAQRLARGGLSRYGMHFTTDLVFLGLSPVNAWFKNVSMDALFPSLWWMHGYIGGERDVIQNRALLDVLGINMVLTTTAEGPVPAGLLPLHRMEVERFMDLHELVLLGNPEAWPKAVLMEPDAGALALPLRPGCSHQGALCRDYTALAAKRLAGDVAMTSSDSRYTARFTPADRERLLFMSEIYRPEFQATASGGRLRIDPVAGAFLGITVPAGVDAVDLAFVPRARIALTWFSGVTLLVLLVSFFVLWRRGSPQPLAPQHVAH